MRGAPEVLFRRLELMSQLLSSILTSMELSAIATLMGLLEDVQLKRLSLYVYPWTSGVSEWSTVDNQDTYHTFDSSGREVVF